MFKKVISIVMVLVIATALGFESITVSGYDTDASERSVKEYLSKRDMYRSWCIIELALNMDCKGRTDFIELHRDEWDRDELLLLFDKVEVWHVAEIHNEVGYCVDVFKYDDDGNVIFKQSLILYQW